MSGLTLDKVTRLLCEQFEKGEVPSLEKILDDATPDEFWSCRCGEENAIGAKSCRSCSRWRPNCEVKRDDEDCERFDGMS